MVDMRYLVIISLWLYIQPANSQGKIEMLTAELTSSCKTDREKVNKIFWWITDNIAYRTREIKKSATRTSSLSISPAEEDDSSPLKPLNERVAENVLSSGVAVCDGYARLFKTMCDYAGIRSEIVIGYAKSNAGKPGKKFSVNHFWNAVFFDEQWHLLDASWASGYISLADNKFVKAYDGRYFLTDPKVFIRDHFPDDARWTLLPDTVVPDEFRYSPFKQTSFIKYSITSFSPAKGVIETAVGDTVHFELETANTAGDKQISPGLLVDSSLFTHSVSWIFLQPAEPLLPENKQRYAYAIVSPEIQWLYLLYNNDIVLRYKINIRGKKDE